MPVSSSPDNFFEFGKTLGIIPSEDIRPIVCIQGLGFVGSAMAVAVALAKDSTGNPRYNVIGVDLPTQLGAHRISQLNSGAMHFKSIDQKLNAGLAEVRAEGNFFATSNPTAYSLADIVIIDVPLNVTGKQTTPTASWDSFLGAIDIVGSTIREKTLVIVETTVPPGTCERVVAPKLRECFERRGISEFYLAHSYERVMPGEKYLDSIINFYRVYSGLTPEGADRCETFLQNIINTEDFPLTRLHSTVASETGKILENSYRAANIAFIEEWGRFAESVGVNLFEVLDAIRLRPTHNNIRQPGFGVGGYCLTKDALFAEISARELFHLPDLKFGFSEASVEINNRMPLVSIDKLEQAYGGSLSNRQILLLGVTYRPGVGDTRYSPSEVFYRECVKRGGSVIAHDPLVSYWDELALRLSDTLPNPKDFDAIVLAVGHEQYRNLNFQSWMADSPAILFDANGVLSEEQIHEIVRAKIKLIRIGDGSIREQGEH